jgi:cbb3-type cytochrome oxidase cytochrome c subunit
MTRTAAACLISLALLTGGACASRGKAVYIREGCVNCHQFKGLGGGPGPDLSDVAARKDGAAIRAQVTNPGANPASRMPSFKHISWLDLHSLAAFLRS